MSNKAAASGGLLLAVRPRRLPGGAAAAAAFPKAGTATSRRSSVDSFSTEDARDRTRRGRSGDAARRGRARHVGRRYRRRRGLLYRAPVAARRRARAGAGRRTSFRRRATGSRSGSSANGSTMSRSGWQARRPDASRRIRSTASSWSTCIMRCTQPYEFLWHLRDGLKPGGLVIVVDSDRPVKRHGMPPRAAQVRIRGAWPCAGQRPAMLAGSDAYFAAFRLGRRSASAG